MLPNANRLIEKEDFEAVYRKGKPLFCDNIVLIVAKNGLKTTKIGLSVGIKFSKKAVKRNRIKRQIRAIMHKKLEQLAPGFNIVINVKKIGQNEECALDEVEKRLNTALKKGNLIK
jgi:ribonuclease P protein component